MYIPANNYITPGLRVSFIHSLHNDKGYSIKNLRKIDERLARDYSQTQLYGGSFKSFWKKVGQIGKKVLNAPAQIASKIYPAMKKGIDFLAKNETAKNLISAIPKAGPIINEGIKHLSKITDVTDKIIENIRNKNPSVAVNEAKNLVTGIRDAVKDVTDKTTISEEQKKKIKDNADKVYNALPSVIKSEGLEKVQKAAGYLPFLDPATMKVMERTSKKGGVLKPKIRFTKPKIITEYKDVFKKFEPYNPETVGVIGGKVFFDYIKKTGNKLPKTIQGVDKDGYAISPEAYINKLEKQGKHEEAEEVRKRQSKKYGPIMKEKSGRAGRVALGGEEDSDDAEEFIQSIRNKMRVKKTK